MKPRLMSGIAMATISVFVVIAGLWTIRLQSVDDIDVVRLAELARVPSEGERVNISALRKDESVVVLQIMRRHMWNEARHYIIEGDVPKFTVQTSQIRYDRGYGLRPENFIEAQSGTLSSNEAKGLDKFLNYLRLRVPMEPHRYDTFEVSYFRSGRKIGSENFVTNSVWTLLDNHYNQLPAEVRSRFTEEDWSGIRTFERVEFPKP